MKTKKRGRKGLTYIVLLIFIIAVLDYALAYEMPMANISPPNPNTPEISSKHLSISWPAGESAVGIQNFGIIGSSPVQTPTPTASIAKLVTILCVLKLKPLSPGQQGPTIILTQNDVNIYANYLAQDGSVAPVQAGERITEYQALQALLLPSADNMADTLADWAFGSVSNYTAYANHYVSSLGLTNTHIADASGLSPQTTSTPTDLIQLGQIAMSNQVIADIVAQKTATIPVAGTVRNVNWLLGTNNIIGIKTGNSDQAGGTFLLAARYPVLGQDLTVFVSVMKASNLENALDESDSILKNFISQIQPTTIVPKNSILGEYKTKWEASSEIKTSTAVVIPEIPTVKPTIAISLNPVAINSPVGKVVGLLSVREGSIYQTSNLYLDKSITKPSWAWRLTHPIQIFSMLF